MSLRSSRFTGDPVLESCLAGEHVVRSGETSDSVRLVQQTLIDLGYTIPDGATGEFSRDSQEALRAFQKDHGLAPYGVIGPLTMKALDSAVLALSG